MRLHRLSITAFGPFADTQEVDFDTLCAAGIFLLHGATGAGKTSVLDAVCYALYDAVPGARQLKGGAAKDASLRSDHAPAGTYTEVQLELTLGGRRLEITRRPAQTRPKKRGTGVTTEKAQSLLREYDTPGSGTGNDAASTGWRALSRSHQEIGEEIGQLLGMSREQFCQVVLLPQGDFARFLRADAEARGKLLGRLFDTRRFAAVEDRLAELRRGAEQQVRAGDERLLGVAQRIAQASGTGVGVGGASGAAVEQPLPAQQPGDPGLAPAVLEWAAVARSTAYERGDIADSALAGAESRQAAARRLLESTRELARLQQRFADGQRRAEALEARRPQYEAARARLEQARKADQVAPALALREDAERAHRTAAAALGRARAGLPAELTDTGADHLSALERKMIEELGRVDAARGAERRSAEISRERAELDRQARADDELLAEAGAGSPAGTPLAGATRNASRRPRRPPPAPNSSRDNSNRRADNSTPPARETRSKHGPPRRRASSTAPASARTTPRRPGSTCASAGCAASPPNSPPVSCRANRARSAAPPTIRHPPAPARARSTRRRRTPRSPRPEAPRRRSPRPSANTPPYERSTRRPAPRPADPPSPNWPRSPSAWAANTPRRTVSPPARTRPARRSPAPNESARTGSPHSSRPRTASRPVPHGAKRSTANRPSSNRNWSAPGATPAASPRTPTGWRKGRGCSPKRPTP